MSRAEAARGRGQLGCDRRRTPSSPRRRLQAWRHRLSGPSIVRKIEDIPIPIQYSRNFMNISAQFHHLYSLWIDIRMNIFILKNRIKTICIDLGLLSFPFVFVFLSPHQKGKTHYDQQKLGGRKLKTL